MMVNTRPLLVLVALFTATACSNASSVTVFSEDFDDENGGNPTLNFTDLSQFEITTGSIDLIGDGFFDFAPGNGLFLDLNGTTGISGTIVSNELFAPGSYTLQFTIITSNSGENSVSVSLGDFSEEFTRGVNAPLEIIERDLVVTSESALVFSTPPQDGDTGGIVLDAIFVSLNLPSVDLGISAQSTFLQPVQDVGFLDDVDDAEIIDLQSSLPFEVSPGDAIRLTALGDFNFATNDDDTGGPFGNGTLGDVFGVFSGSGTLLGEEVANRVPDAITPQEGDFSFIADGFLNEIIPDIEADFVIPNEAGEDTDGIEIQVPLGATHLFLGAADEVFGDNNDPNNGESEPDFGIRIELVSEFLEGDFNSDGVVDLADYAVGRDNLGVADVGQFGPGDANGDGQVTTADYQIFVDQFGTSLGDSTPADSSAFAAVPEPSSLMLLLPALSFRGRVRS